MSAKTLVPLALALGAAGAGLALLAWTDPPVRDARLDARALQASSSVEAPVVDPVAVELVTAFEELRGLEAELTRSEVALAKARKELTRLHGDRADHRERLAELQAEAARAATALGTATAARDALVATLVEAGEALQVARGEQALLRAQGERWQALALAEGFEGFVAQAQLTACERGTRLRHGRCRQAVDEALRQPEVEATWRRCASTGQAVPVLARRAADEALPAFSAPLPDARAVDGRWYVAWCDPLLPEAGGASDAG